MDGELKNKSALSTHQSEFLIYQATDGRVRIDVRLEDETVWLTQDHMAELFGKSKKTISEHIRNIFSEGELDKNVVVRKFRSTTQHGAIPDKTQSRNVQFYSLDVIISVGYRVKSHQGTQFRIWATQRLKEYIVKGFALNDERFKKGSSMNYFNEPQYLERRVGQYSVTWEDGRPVIKGEDGPPCRQLRSLRYKVGFVLTLGPLTVLFPAFDVWDESNGEIADAPSFSKIPFGAENVSLRGLARIRQAERRPGQRSE